jgi:hypothetical protein
MTVRRIDTQERGSGNIGPMIDPTPRLAARIERDFGDSRSRDVIRRLARLRVEPFGGQDPERVQAALVLASCGSWDLFAHYLQLLAVDWRDVLVAGDLADRDWPMRLAAELPST